MGKQYTKEDWREFMFAIRENTLYTPEEIVGLLKFYKEQSK